MPCMILYYPYIHETIQYNENETIQYNTNQLYIPTTTTVLSTYMSKYNIKVLQSRFFNLSRHTIAPSNLAGVSLP